MALTQQAPCAAQAQMVDVSRGEFVMKKILFSIALLSSLAFNSVSAQADERNLDENWWQDELSLPEIEEDCYTAKVLKFPWKYPGCTPYPMPSQYNETIASLDPQDYRVDTEDNNWLETDVEGASGLSFNLPPTPLEDYQNPAQANILYDFDPTPGLIQLDPVELDESEMEMVNYGENMWDTENGTIGTIAVCKNNVCTISVNGLFKNQYSPGKQIELVISNDNGAKVTKVYIDGVYVDRY
jgi:hypothetical protein